MKLKKLRCITEIILHSTIIIIILVGVTYMFFEVV